MYLFLPYRALNSFSDVVLLRDPKGKSVFRSLHRLPALSEPGGKGTGAVRGPGIGITGPFVMHHLFAVSKEQGLAFVTATGDENPIHREGDVIPGAMTTARAVSSLEALFPCLGVSRLRMKFRSIARYGVPMRQQMALSFRENGTVDVSVRIDQGAHEVVEGLVTGKIHSRIQRPNVGKWRVNREELMQVEAFFRSLAIVPDLYLRAGNELNYAYPRGYLAALPSGEMVRQLSGAGGLLTSLELSFPEGPPPGITGSGRPEVGLQTAKTRPSFWKILTWIKHGLDEHCTGFALVFAPKQAPGAAPASV
jgi:hypothetical protein